MKTRLMCLLIAAALGSSAALAAEPAKAPAAPSAEQQAARAEIDKLVERIKVLSGQLGDGSDVRVIIRRSGMGMGPGMPGHEGMMPGAMDHGMMMDHDMMMEHGCPADAKGDGSKCKIRIERIGGPGDMPGMPGMREGMPMDDGGMRDIRIERRAGPDMMRSGPGLGIVMAPNPAAAGVRIAAVTPDSPAQKAGLRANDVILAINGKTVSGSGAAAVDNARSLLGVLKTDQVVKLRYAREGKAFDASVKAGDIRRIMLMNRDGGDMPRMHDGDMHRRMMMLPPGVEMEIERVGPMADCGKNGKDGKDCGLPNLYQAFRWQGLNLSSIDAGLGRYFGTDKGVLVLSSGPEMKGLQSGDVIQRVAGTAVDSPRDVMRALRDKDAGSQLQMDVLRDRKSASVSVTVPESRPLPFMEAPPPPPAPPAPPAAPRTPRPAPPAPPPPPGN